ncbi:MAG: shikimate kinase [Verrucomicrobia bacterium]|nr:shikimate kinase [Verrucomicrobiota bacterium]
MKLLFLHGPPAAGKLTVACEVAARTGWRLFHNHLTVNLALAVYDFGTPGFIALREEVWLAVFRRALADHLPGLIFTFNPENSVPQRFIDELFAEVAAAGGEVIPVELTASEAELERRMGLDSRVQHGKLTDLALYRQLRAAGTFLTPVIPGSRLRLDTGTLSPEECAARIVSHL